MTHDFRRGFQMIVHDPRLNNPNTTPPSPLKPPAAYNVWTVDPALHSPDHIINWSAAVADQVPSHRRLDALHFMAHGNRAYMEIGTGGFHAGNVAMFARLAGKTSWIVFWSCLVSSDNHGGYHGHPEYFGQQIARMARCRTVMAQRSQEYSFNSGGVIEFGAWEGPVDVFEPNGNWSTYQDYNPFRASPSFELDGLIFP